MGSEMCIRDRMEESAAQEWLRKHGFATDDLRREIDICVSAGTGTTLMCPMAAACHEGNEDMCEWLYDHGAEVDITKTHDEGYTPMHWACKGGHLSVCKWLCDVGAAGDITMTSMCGSFPMHEACWGGHLSVCQWLVLNSALNDPTSEQVDEAIVQRTARLMSNHTRPNLLSWARDMIDTHDTFLNVFLRASVILPASQQHVHPSARCLLPRLHRACLLYTSPSPRDS